MGKWLARNEFRHVGLEIEHRGDRRAEVVVLVPRQPARHPHELVDGDLGAVIGPLRTQPGVGDGDLALFDDPPGEQARGALGHRPPQLRCGSGESGGIALGHELATLHDDDGSRPQKVLFKRREVVAEGFRNGCSDGRGRRGNRNGVERVRPDGHLGQRPGSRCLLYTSRCV